MNNINNINNINKCLQTTTTKNQKKKKRKEKRKRKKEREKVFTMSDSVHHSHRPSSLKQSNKPFKSKHSTKGQIKEQQKGKVNRVSQSVKHKGHQTKNDRRNAAKIAQKSKREVATCFFDFP